MSQIQMIELTETEVQEVNGGIFVVLGLALSTEACVGIAAGVAAFGATTYAVFRSLRDSDATK